MPETGCVFGTTTKCEGMQSGILNTGGPLSLQALFQPCSAFTRFGLTHDSFRARAGRLRRGQWRMTGKVLLLLSRYQASPEVHPAGAREFQIFKELGCRLSVLTHTAQTAEFTCMSRRSTSKQPRRHFNSPSVVTAINRSCPRTVAGPINDWWALRLST